ncbi:hypothetical protein DYH09_05455 [bacterium CPR1]|nr:hypothetical protein [bacterium CPR1]
MSLAAVVASCLLLVAGYFLSWSDKLQEIEMLRQQAIELRQRPQKCQSDLAELPALTARAAELEAKVQALRQGLKLQPDPTATSAMAKKLQQEWRGLLKRPGLKVSITVQDILDEMNYGLNPSVSVKLQASGPKDELFRLLDGLLRQARPTRLRRLNLECGPDRGQAAIEVEVYYSPGG